MKRRIISLGICVGAALAVMLAVQHSTEAQREDRRAGRPERQQGGQFMIAQMLPLEASYAQVSFELGVDDEALVKARRVYKKAWDDRKKLMEKMGDARGDREATQSARGEAEKLRDEVNKKLADVLTAEQLKKLAEWEKIARERSRRPPGMPAGGGRRSQD